MHRVQTIATGLQGGEWLSTMYFSTSGGSAAAAKSAVTAFWTACAPVISSNVSMVVQADVFDIDPADGAILGVEVTTQTTVLGTESASPLAGATQGLLRLFTGAYLGGRQVRGRTYIWGPTVDQLASGGTSGTYRSTVNAAAATLIADAGSQLVVWSRKNEVAVPVSNGVMWTEFAVQRSRRD